jgi:hypothetical protein
MQRLRAAVEFARLVLGREALGELPAPPSAAARRGVLHLLFVSREPLPFDPEPTRPTRRGWLAALFAPEKLDDSQ